VRPDRKRDRLPSLYIYALQPCAEMRAHAAMRHVEIIEPAAMWVPIQGPEPGRIECIACTYGYSVETAGLKGLILGCTFSEGLAPRLHICSATETVRGV
jgi:hypothetical protein